jgi:23S rRNA G2069 N7-methylase RlmK/C1962 C5-methylase RlmI
MGEVDAKTALQAEMLANRLKKRSRHLAKWAQRTGTDAFRLYDRDIPEIPLILDKYGDAVSGALYQRPYEKDEAEEEQWLAAMREATAQALGLEQDNIIIKRREHQRRTVGSGQTQYEKISNQKTTRIVREGNLKFKVNLSDYLDTGLFIDRRAMRRLVGDDSKGKRVLNLFCYTGSFSVHAAGGNGAPKSGATATCSVDLSNTYLAWARDNFTLNGYKTETLRLEEYFVGMGSGGAAMPPWGVGVRHRRIGELQVSPAAHLLVRADCATFLNRAAEARLRWDAIILDPPAFSNSTGTADFDLQRDYAGLLAQCCALLAKDGKLWFSAAARSFKTSAEELETELAKRHRRVTVTDIGSKLIDEDFKGRKMPKAFVIQGTKNKEQ